MSESTESQPESSTEVNVNGGDAEVNVNPGGESGESEATESSESGTEDGSADA